jgi:macrolide-specific efflux system membrane fusion protein
MFAEADATKIKAKQVAKVTWNALTSTSVDAAVASVDPNSTTSNSVVSYGVVLSLSTVPAEARPGQTLTVDVTTGEVQNVIRVPSAAVRTAGGRRTVVVSANGQQTATQVEVGLEGDSFTEITSGLTVGEQVVLPTTTTSSTSGNNFGGGGLGGLTGGGGFTGGGGTGRTGGGGTGRTGTGN